MHGSIALPLWRGSVFVVAGGPYRKKPEKYFGVKMAAEIKLPCAVDVPVVDFSTPSVEELERGVMETLDLVLAGKPVYVGCIGGIGRTGMMLAALAKVFGIEEPIQYVRQNYYSHAVETPEQKALLEQWVVPPHIKKRVFWAKVKNVFSKKKVLTN